MSRDRLFRPAPTAADALDSGAPEQGSWSSRALIQRKLQRRLSRQLEQADAQDSGDVQKTAERGVAGAGAALPHLGAIQRSFGRHDVSKIDAHIGPEASAASTAIGAEAFATGNHVAFDGAPSLHTAAHEAAHVVQQRAGVHCAGAVGQAGDPLEQHADQVADRVVRGESSEALLDEMSGGRRGENASSAAAGPVQAKLAGVYDVLKEHGGGKSRVIKGEWSKILEKVKRYEALEEDGEKTPRQLLPRLNDIIIRFEIYVNGEEHHDRGNKNRLEQIQLVLQRLRSERNDLENGRENQSFDDSRVLEYEDNKYGGQLNTIDYIKYTRDDGGVQEGFFKEEKELTELGKNHQRLGLSKEQPNFNGRAVALSRIDELLQTNVVVPTSFATHRRQRLDGDNHPNGAPIHRSGIFMERAKGVEVHEGIAKQKNGDIGGDQQPGRLNLDDPLLQRSLNKLQLLDVLCGSVDRHMGNVFVDQDESGSVTSVSGIDNDLSFAKNLGTERTEDTPLQYKGLPSLVDSDLAKGIMALQPHDLRQALAGLIDDAEIEATIGRLVKIKRYLHELPMHRKIKEGQWGRDTRRMQTGDDSYLGEMARDIFDHSERGARWETVIKQTYPRVGGHYLGGSIFGTIANRATQLESDTVIQRVVDRLGPVVDFMLQWDEYRNRQEDFLKARAEYTALISERVDKIIVEELARDRLEGQR